jgi:hypothetical protein
MGLAVSFADFADEYGTAHECFIRQLDLGATSILVIREFDDSVGGYVNQMH